MEAEVAPPLAVLADASRSLAAFAQSDEAARRLVEGSDPLPDDYLAIARAALEAGGARELRLEKRRRLMQIAVRDLEGELRLEDVGRALSDLADACLQVTLDAIGAPEGLAVIAMGKLGGRELNYSSDIDLMFVGDADGTDATRAAETLVAELGGFFPEGQAFRIDLALRPEGGAGALVRSLEGYLEYYKRWAKEWEFQALIKARVAAGAPDVGERFIDLTRPFVYPETVSQERVAEIRRMKERVEGHAHADALRARSADADDVKLGPGGIRDIEFSLQLLQLVHGGTDASLRSPTTLDALRSLVDGGYVAEEDGAGLEVAYRWLRNVEHRLQLWQERQTHTLPRDTAALNRLGRTLGFRDSHGASAGERFITHHRAVLADVRLRFEKLFYRPMVEALAGMGAGALSTEALKDRLRILGFRDVDRAARTLEGLVSGTSRRVKVFRLLTPAMLRFLATAPLPDEGLFGFLRLGESLKGRVDALGSFRDNPPGLALLAKVLGSGRFLADVLAHVPEELATIADPHASGDAKDRPRLVREAEASLGWRGPDRLLEGLRRFKRRETVRVALADVSGAIDAVAVGSQLSDIAEACLEAASDGSPDAFCVIGMGKLGGRELGYGSDLDVMFVYDGDPRRGERRAEDLMKALGEVTPEGQAFRMDAGLRPEGKNGPLARSLESYVEYYRRWSQPWEHQALVKARPVAGSVELGHDLLTSVADLPFPGALSAAHLAEVRHLKARMERERIPRGVDPRRHLKLGPGGMSDIEFAIQVVQMEHGADVQGLRATGTVEAIEAARANEILPDDDASMLTDAYRFLLRVRNRMFFMYARPVDALPVKPEDLEALGIATGFTDQPRQELEDAYLKIMRRSRRVCERLIYGDSATRAARTAP